MSKNKLQQADLICKTWMTESLTLQGSVLKTFHDPFHIAVWPSHTDETSLLLSKGLGIFSYFTRLGNIT